MARRKANAEEKAKYLGYLKEGVKEGMRIYGVLRSDRDNSSTFDVYYISPGTDKEAPCLIWITGYIATVLGYRRGKRHGIVVGGGGYNKLAHVVNELSYELFGKSNGLTYHWV